VAVIAEESVVTKQSRGFYASIGSLVSMYVDKGYILAVEPLCVLKKTWKSFFKFVAFMFSGIIISPVFLVALMYRSRPTEGLLMHTDGDFQTRR